ncbi:MAG: hypothetical protein AVDCRST_MAG93-4061, partial [uncultured Chloroflexia bacterium]
CSAWVVFACLSSSWVYYSLPPVPSCSSWPHFFQFRVG